MTSSISDRQVMGWREWVSFPELGISQIKAKIDTGARTGCLHAFFVEPFERDGVEWVHFDIHPIQGDTSEVLRCEAPVLDQRLVRDSGGHEEMRYVIETIVSIGGNTLKAEVTLSDRDSMKFLFMVVTICT